MFFLLSKILAYLIMPFVVSCSLLIASVLIRAPRLKKRLRIAGIAMLLFFSNEFIANEVSLRWEVPITPFASITKRYEWGILLTGVTRHEDGLDDRVFFGRGADRVTHTVQLYKLGKIKKILVSGGSGRLVGRDRKEADEVADALKLMGVPDSVVVKESASRNTHESAEAVKKILYNRTTPGACLLVTSAYHMRRASACFRKSGWPTDCFSTDFHSQSRKFSPDVLLIPSLEALGTWQIIIKEWVGLISYWVVGYV